MDIRQTMTIQRIRSAHRIDQNFSVNGIFFVQIMYITCCNNDFIQTFPISTKFWIISSKSCSFYQFLLDQRRIDRFWHNFNIIVEFCSVSASSTLFASWLRIFLPYHKLSRSIDFHASFQLGAWYSWDAFEVFDIRH